jgi:hypothetical protein
VSGIASDRTTAIVLTTPRMLNVKVMVIPSIPGRGKTPLTWLPQPKMEAPLHGKRCGPRSRLAIEPLAQESSCFQTLMLHCEIQCAFESKAVL